MPRQESRRLSWRGIRLFNATCPQLMAPFRVMAGRRCALVTVFLALSNQTQPHSLEMNFYDIAQISRSSSVIAAGANRSRMLSTVRATW
jgi:hypothetical protein